MSPGIGLGLERLGLWSLRFPRVFALLLLVFTGGLVMALPGLRFQGDILAQIDEGGPLWQEYETLSDDFAFAAPDIYVVFEAPGTGDDLGQWLARQSRLVLDLRLTPGVGDVQSLFSLREIEGDAMAPLFDPQTDSLTPGGLAQIADQRPDVALFLDASGPVSRMAIAMDRQTASQASRSDRLVAQVDRLVQASGLSAQLAGRAVMQRDMSRTLLSDLLRMVVLSIVVGWVVGFLIFTDMRAVIVTNVVSPIAMVWTAGFAALTGQALDPLSVILPLLASIIAFADAVHLVVPLQRRLADAPSPRMATRDIVQEIGPATALTSMTTALAFGSLALAGGEMTRIAGLGVAAVILAWIAVMTVTPLLCLALARKGLGSARFGSDGFRARFRTYAEHTVRAKVWIASLALVATVVLVVAADHLPSEHVPEDYVPLGSDIREAEDLLQSAFSGSLSLLVSMPLAVPGDPSDPENRDRLRDWHEAIEAASPGDAVWSRARLPEALASLIPENGPDISRDGESLLIVINHGWRESGTDSLARVARLRAAVAGLAGGEEARISGVSAVVAEAAIEDIEQLRRGLYLSVVLAAGLVALLCRNLAAGAALGLSVLLSVLTVLVGGALWGGVVSYGLTVALIVSVGIAIDDGIHLINRAGGRAGHGTITPERWCRSAGRTGGAIVVSSVILIVTISVTQFTEMPALRSIGREVMLAMAVALGLTLTVIVPLALLFERISTWRLRKKA